MLAVSGLEACGAMYSGDLARDDPRVSPLFGDLEGLSPIAIFSGTSDILIVDGRRLAKRLDEPGMPEHVYYEYKDMFHVWMLLPVPEGGASARRDGGFHPPTLEGFRMRNALFACASAALLAGCQAGEAVAQRAEAPA